MRAVLTTLALVSLALLAFAGNSLLARAALADGAIEAGAFSAIRLASGALILLPVLGRRPGLADAPGAAALAVYVAGFSLAYLSLGAGIGALILFACVQATILVVGIVRGERPGVLGWCGLALAFAGLIVLLAPGSGAGRQAVPLAPAALMASAGVAWGAYTLIGRGSADATAGHAGTARCLQSRPVR
jgi:drug/metabolite transporter (DMT)-like permease